MRRHVLATTAIAVLAAAVATAALIPALASADVQRYQGEHATLAVAMPQQGWVHTYKIELNPCDGTFTGTGSSQQTAGTTNEAITGTLNNNTVSFNATYLPGGIFPGYTWGVKSAQLGAQVNYWDAWGQELPTVSTLSNATFTTYKNHGDYVSSAGGGADAGHACIGMPINS
jgi:hypothetical protein